MIEGNDGQRTEQLVAKPCRHICKPGEFNGSPLIEETMKKYNELHPIFETWTDFYKMAKDKISMNDPNVKEITYHHREDFKDEEIITYCINIDFMKARVLEELQSEFITYKSVIDVHLPAGFIIRDIDNMLCL